ncbi:MAG: oxidoreductase domain protein [Acidobacteria bacterium]|jgi:predicted dehydrogenase|nr:oxidoreductase domain protein [Acidobacteriota bacterium]
MSKIKAAVIGAGFMGRVHTEGIRRLGNVEVVAVAAITADEAATFGKVMGIDKTTGDYREILADPSIQAVHVCTPNALHYKISMDAMRAGKHVLCEKPLALSAAEAKEMAALAREKGLANCVNHNLRYYPLLQHARRMIEKGELGEILVVQGTYSQDWLLYDTDFNWRVETRDNGALRAMGDIGSHWMDMIQHLTGQKITSVCADLAIFHKTRKKPKVAVETFAGKQLRPEDYEEVPIDTDDYGAVLLKLGRRAHGAFTVSQVSAGCKNRFQVEIFGTKSGLIWNQEEPNTLWIGERNSPNKIVVKDPSLIESTVSGFAEMPGGHAEGYGDAHKQVYKRFYRKVADPSAPVEYPTFEDGAWGMHLLEKVLESSRKRAWIDTL